MGKNKREPVHESYEMASGPIAYNMTNDYMFRAILQKNEFVLRGLIGALLHLDQADIKSVEITNPIILGEQIENKQFVLDINITLNNNICLNLELQVINRTNWQYRSLIYLCRMFDRLQRGEDYAESGCAIHIGILDFTLFEEVPEFYACYKMLNVKNHHVFNEKFVLNVLDLKRIDLATEEDRRYEIDCWARMFKAGTWEELRMIAEKNKYMSEAAMAMYELNADEIIRQQCMAREEYNRYEKMMARKLAEANEQLAEANEQLAGANEQIAEARKDAAEATRQFEQERSNYEAEIARLQELIAQKQN